jgi:hypothetical protein
MARPFSEDALLIEGHLVRSHVPIELRRLLPMPPMKSTVEESARYEEAFNLLALYASSATGRPDAGGATRWRYPFCGGRLRSRQIPKPWRGPRSRPLVAMPEGTTCCNGTVTASADELPHWQRFLPGTTAWRSSCGWRQVVDRPDGGVFSKLPDLTVPGQSGRPPTVKEGTSHNRSEMPP